MAARSGHHFRPYEAGRDHGGDGPAGKKCEWLTA